MYYNARWYDSQLGRFAQADSMVPGGVQGYDRYAYVNNNPLRYTDPSGHSVDCAIGENYCESGTLNIQRRAFDTAFNTSKNYPGLTYHGVESAFPANASILNEAGWTENMYNEIKHGNASTADAWHDPLTYIEIAVIGGETVRASYNLLMAMSSMCSFSENTKVTTSEGEKEISEIEVGDYVLAWNEESGETGYYEVTSTFSHADKALTELVIDGEWIETTPEHPFYTEEQGWLPADELMSGMHIRQANGDYKLVWTKWNIHKTQQMYNLTVDTAHTFFVGDGQWLVHNNCPIPPMPPQFKSIKAFGDFIRWGKNSSLLNGTTEARNRLSEIQANPSIINNFANGGLTSSQAQQWASWYNEIHLEPSNVNPSALGRSELMQFIANQLVKIE